MVILVSSFDLIEGFIDIYQPINQKGWYIQMHKNWVFVDVGFGVKTEFWGWFSGGGVGELKELNSWDSWN